jgi:UDPglucose 6-dehydrogenase
LAFTTDVINAISEAEVIFLCLPTPQGDDGSADLSYIEAVSKQVGPHLQSGTVVVNKSTVPVGSSVVVAGWLGRSDVSVVSNPEFLRQGTALHDFLNPTRIVVGGDNEEAVDKVASLYAAVDAPILRMNAASAEALKYAANSFLATKLTFINAIADICELVGADIFDVVGGLGLDPRIGDQFLNPGPGWGGSCFPKDTRALVKIAEGNGYDFALLRGVIQTNDEQYERIALKVVELCGGSVNGKTIASWGLTFKANTDDLRDSPAIAILSTLHSMGARIRAYDSAARGVEQYPWIERCESALDACDGADALAVLTEWPEFSSVSPQEVFKKLSHPAVVDGRNILNPSKWKDAGFEYRGVGRA